MRNFGVRKTANVKPLGDELVGSGLRCRSSSRSHRGMVVVGRSTVGVSSSLLSVRNLEIVEPAGPCGCGSQLLLSLSCSLIKDASERSVLVLRYFLLKALYHGRDGKALRAMQGRATMGNTVSRSKMALSLINVRNFEKRQ